MGQESVAKSRRECSDLSWPCIYRKAIIVSAACQDIKELLETRILSLGMTFFSIWFLCMDTIPGRQGEH